MSSLSLWVRHRHCHTSNLNGFNFGDGETPYAIGIVWYPITGYYKSLAKMEMAVKGEKTDV